MRFKGMDEYGPGDMDSQAGRGRRWSGGGATVPMLSRLSDSWFFPGFFSGRCPRAGPTFEDIKLIVKAPFLLQGTAPPGPENVVDVDHFGRAPAPPRIAQN